MIENTEPRSQSAGWELLPNSVVLGLLKEERGSLAGHSVSSRWQLSSLRGWISSLKVAFCRLPSLSVAWRWGLFIACSSVRVRLLTSAATNAKRRWLFRLIPLIFAWYAYFRLAVERCFSILSATQRIQKPDFWTRKGARRSAFVRLLVGSFICRKCATGSGLRIPKTSPGGSQKGQLARLCSPSLGIARLRSPFCRDGQKMQMGVALTDRVSYCPRVAHWIRAVSDCGLCFIGSRVSWRWLRVSVNGLKSAGYDGFSPLANKAADKSADADNRIANGSNLLSRSQLGRTRAI